MSTLPVTSNVKIIAEIGVNHNADMELAVKMIKAAKDAGADFAKFQTAKPELVISRFAQKADYQKKTTASDESQLEMNQKLHFSYKGYASLKHICDNENIPFCSTPFDLESIDFLNSLNMPFWKIPSGEITNLPYLIKVAQIGEPIILSTGMSTLDEVRQAVDILQKHGCKDLTLLHCNTQYPTPPEDANVRAMVTLREAFSLPVGYSDHTQGIEAALAAVALGATVIEKHFTLSCDMEGPDQKASMEPEPFKQMVQAIRKIEMVLGNGIKTVTNSERENISIARKSIVAKCEIKAGEVFTEDNITAKRPGTGVSPMFWFEVLGQEAKRDFGEDELIEM